MIQNILAALAAFAIAGVTLSACARPPALAAPEGVTLTPLRTIHPLEARVLLLITGVKGLPVRHAVDCYRMTYYAPGKDGAPALQSGVFALPRGAPARRLVSFQHGTSTTRSAVPSSLDGTGLAASILFAGNGYALIAPDYPGLGASDERHPYYVADRIAPAILAMIDAARQIEGVPDASIFLSGFSEGGWASLAALRALEARGESVLGAAIVAGPIDIRAISLPAALRGGAPSHALYLAYLAWGYSDHYGRPLESALNEDAARTVARVLSDGSSPQEIVAALPADPRALFRQDFLDAVDGDGAHWLSDAIQANGLAAFTPRAPVRLYYGSNDADVAPEEAREGARRMRAAGADAEAVDVGPFDHDGSMLAAAPAIFNWLAALDAAR